MPFPSVLLISIPTYICLHFTLSQSTGVLTVLPIDPSNILGPEPLQTCNLKLSMYKYYKTKCLFYVYTLYITLGPYISIGMGSQGLACVSKLLVQKCAIFEHAHVLLCVSYSVVYIYCVCVCVCLCVTVIVQDDHMCLVLSYEYTYVHTLPPTCI